MHETMVRLYEATKNLLGKEGQTNIAVILDESPQTLNNWESRGISKKGAIKAQSIIGCSAPWLLSGKGSFQLLPSADAQDTMVQTRPARTKTTDNEITLNQYATGGAMGHGVLLRDQPGTIQSWKVTKEWLHKNVRSHSGSDNLCIVTGFGDSMRPMFNPGDPLLVDSGIKVVEFDAIYFFRVGEEGFIKRLQRIPGEGLRVISTNKEYETWTVKPDMDFEVFGRVLKVWCSEDF